ncbi:hypothetical protein BWQ96_08668 [Gracilariopsis chorda]|uniref:Uncharacterized protein n=1 Tax=Gracilariopsis chorda TaxID=448386 RepID=A0A2V3IHU9_9FLOR|nr:hypothetical protein BWQ96_08668 [Gracilariopsis chorda]|eukprot:PXF41657.1 hypothetical protein BWQ96_08668 [Gracilariopsis chorda]
MVEVDRVRASARLGRYVPIPDHWAAIEAPRGCPAEIPPVITYLGSHLVNDPYCGLWVVACTEFIAKMAVFILWDAYDTYRVSYMSPTAREYARNLDLSLVLGSRANQEDFRHLMNVMDQINWDLVPADQAARGNRSRQREYSPGRTADAGDFVWYDPWTRQHLTSEQAPYLRQNPRAQPATQPTGYIFEPYAAVMDYMSEDGDADYSEGPYEMDTEAPIPEEDTTVNPLPVNLGYQQPQQNSADDESELELLRRFLEEAGVPLTYVQGDRQHLLGLLRTNLGQDPNEPSA